MKLQGKKIAIMLDEQYQELEVWYPYYRLSEEGARVELVAPEKNKTYGSKLGYPCVSTAAAGETPGGDFDAVIIPGGWAPDFMPVSAVLAPMCEASRMVATALASK